MRFLEIRASYLVAGNVRRNSQHRHPAAMTIVETVDQMHVAWPATSGTKITLLAAIDEQQKVEIALKGFYTLNPDILMQIPVLEGVSSSAEAA